MNQFLNSLENATNYTRTTNGALSHRSTRSALLDMFSMGGAMRSRSEEDIILMFRNAYAENPTYALKCLFYLRDIRGIGQGERRFFRICFKDLAKQHPEEAIHLIPQVAEFGRFDDLYALLDTPAETAMFDFIKEQLAADLVAEYPSLLGKWLKSVNTSSKTSNAIGQRTRKALGMTNKQYRKTLSHLRTKINIVEKLMSEGRWDEIDFAKLPSRAGLMYREAFRRHDLERKTANPEAVTYEEFAKDENTVVNAAALYPYDVVKQAREMTKYSNPELDDTSRLMVNKYWDNLKSDYFADASLNALVVCDTSGSMCWCNTSVQPIDVAVSLAMFTAERAGGPFANKYISFSSEPQLITVEGVDFVDKVARIYQTNLCENTNIEGVFDLLKQTALSSEEAKASLPKQVLIISDMEFDAATNEWRSGSEFCTKNAETLLEGIAKDWEVNGLELPELIFWNVNCQHANIPMLGNGRISYVSGASPSIFEAIVTGKTGWELFKEVMDNERLNVIYSIADGAVN